VEGIRKLWRLLEGEAESRWGADGLSFDSLRLEVALGGELNNLSVFVARTFRAGWHFDSEQALAWGILELQADCAEKVKFVVFLVEIELNTCTYSFLNHQNPFIHPQLGQEGVKENEFESKILSLCCSGR
jgi:hypothetical protein